MINRVYFKRNWIGRTVIQVDETVYYQYPEWKARTGEHLKQNVVRMATPKDIPTLLELGLVSPKEVKYIR